MFSDETPFHLPGHNLHNVRIVGSNNPHAVAQETTRDGPKIKVFFHSIQRNKFRPFFLAEGKVTGVEHPSAASPYSLVRRPPMAPLKWGD